MVELHLTFEYGLMWLPLHHDNVSLRFHFEHKAETVLTHFQTDKRIRRICAHLVLKQLHCGALCSLK